MLTLFIDSIINDMNRPPNITNINSLVFLIYLIYPEKNLSHDICFANTNTIPGT